jgi:hypothetical protein
MWSEVEDYVVTNGLDQYLTLMALNAIDRPIVACIRQSRRIERDLRRSNETVVAEVRLRTLGTEPHQDRDSHHASRISETTRHSKSRKCDDMHMAPLVYVEK